MKPTLITLVTQRPSTVRVTWCPRILAKSSFRLKLSLCAIWVRFVANLKGHASDSSQKLQLQLCDSSENSWFVCDLTGFARKVAWHGNMDFVCDLDQFARKKQIHGSNSSQNNYNWHRFLAKNTFMCWIPRKIYNMYNSWASQTQDALTDIPRKSP